LRRKRKNEISAFERAVLEVKSQIRGEIICYTKGADDILKKRLLSNNKNILNEVEHSLKKLSNKGL